MDSEGYVSAAEQLRKNLGLTEEEFLNVMKETMERLKGNNDTLIDLDADPCIPSGWSVKKKGQLPNRVRGKLVWDSTKVGLHFSENQQNNKGVEGHRLRRELKNQTVLSANVLDYLLAHPELIPEEWKDKAVFFWGTIYHSADGHLCVRYLYFDDGRWFWNYGELDCGWDSDHPALVFVS